MRVKRKLCKMIWLLAIALSAMRPGQPNRAFDIIRSKLLYHKVFP